jgi:serine/threonine protein kinase
MAASIGNTLLMLGARHFRKPVAKELCRIERLIGRGSFGEVLSGTMSESGVQIAVKRIFQRDVFEHEADILCQLNHPHIVTYIGDFEDDQFGHVIVTEFVRDGNLREFLDRLAGPLSHEALFLISSQLASALAYLHNGQVPIIHRFVNDSPTH